MKATHAKLVFLALLCFSFGLMACERPEEKPDSSAKAEAPQPQPTSEPEPAAARPSTELDENPKISELWGAKHENGVVKVELRDLDEDERKRLAALFADADAPVAFAADKMPERFADVDAVDVLTPEGPTRLEIAQLVQEGGPSQMHYWLHTQKSDALPKDLGWTLATPAGQMGDTARMRPAEPQPVHAKAAPKLAKAFLGALDEKDRDRVAKKLEDEHMLGVSARLPSPHGQVVAINVPGKNQMPLAQGVFVAKDTGEVTHTVKEPFVGPLGTIEILAVADPDGDDIDGVLYRMNTDGYWIKWIHFDEQGNVVVETLAGFAA
ncbi:hypothetical protein FIV42_16315 [Persicimonas caeni]|uniref:Uncharacterized protein n=1 Tax=Persicimonas caeni TaxID=2292766 RepID=A0A4Y6PWW3_PERCE|nr:hypothetical protein [Persicimonas caeni]QDG52245.1 hypothetical protein FIV42_16315 [Persicimonas caeni]QED33467.1 hypothetical protein FRD00_16310 [Persicimonas caeni]